jgi:hypothetical protein
MTTPIIAMSARRAQRGWVGLIVLLIALVIVAMLAQDALVKYGLLRNPATSAAKEPGGLGRSPTPAAIPGDASTLSTPSYATPIERARGVEDTVRQQADDRSRRIDAQK